MEAKVLYDSPSLAKRIKARAKEKGVTAKTMLNDLGLGSNSISHLLHGQTMAHDRLARIADYLDCSVDYLLGRTDNPEINK